MTLHSLALRQWSKCQITSQSPSAEITLPVLCIMTRGKAGSQVTLCGEWSPVPVVSRWLRPGNRAFLEVASMVASWSIKVSIAAQKFATSSITDWKGSDTTWELRMHGGYVAFLCSAVCGDCLTLEAEVAFRFGFMDNIFLYHTTYIHWCEKSNKLNKKKDNRRV